MYESLDGLPLPALFPLERALGIVAGVATPALADLVARVSVDFTQRQVLESLRRQNHVLWGVQTLRNVTRAMAEGIAPHQPAAHVQKLLDWLQQAADSRGPVRFALAVGRNGLMLPIRRKETHKEEATATVSVFDRWGKRLKTIYLGQMPEPGQTTLSHKLTQLLRDVIAQWQGAMPRLVYITDAGFHPRDYFEIVMRRMLNPHRPGQYLAWEWTVDYDRAYGFLRKHSRWMDYAGHRRRRLPMGSGVSEAACKTVFSQRFKCSGMKWDVAGGAVILALRLAVLSNTRATVRDAMFASCQIVLPPTACQNGHTPLAIPA